jgi:hypothetical protein
MKVLTSDAVQDPTRVEARVRREVAMRRHGHEKMNAERKLTDEQRREKTEVKKAEQEKKGIHGAVFKYVAIFISNELLLTGILLFPGSRFSQIPRISSKYARTPNN